MKNRAPMLILLLIAAAFVFGVIKLFQWRFESGDVYPPYSSLRADPLGAMAFYESLEKLPGISVSRDYSAANRLPEGKDTTYLHLAASTAQWRWIPQEVYKEIDAFLRRGGRLVITFEPRATDDPSWIHDPDTDPEDRRSGDRSKPKEKPTGRKSDPEKPDQKPRRMGEDPESDSGRDEILVSDLWGVNFRTIDLRQGGNGSYEPARVLNRTELPLARTLDWHSGVVLSNLKDEWRTIYARGTNAVLAERKIGRGTVVIATDSYFLSNEALQKDRQPELLAWLIGTGRNVYFDEAHFGVVNRPGVVMLMRQYNLHALAAALLLLAALFIWKHSVSLVPPHRDLAEDDYVSGKDAAGGFVNLLRRNIRSRDLLSTCYGEWKKSAAQSGRYTAARRLRAESVFLAEMAADGKDRDPIRTYQTLCTILETRNPGPGAPPVTPDPSALEK